MMKLEEQLAAKFVCVKCKGSGATVKRIAATGAGISRIFNIQHNKFVAVSCQQCGYTEIYNPEMLEGKDTRGDILDVIFGG